MAAYVFPTPESSLETRQNAEAGLKADPENARLWGLLANVLASDVLNSWNGAGAAEVDRAEAAAKKAISIDSKTPLAHYALGFVKRLRGDHNDSLKSFKEAIKLNPNLAKAYAQAANEMVFTGDARGAIPMAEEAIQRSPQDPSIGVFHWVKGRASFTIGDYANAIKALEQSVSVRPNLWFTQAWLIAAYALSNRDADAEAARQKFEKTSFSKVKYDFAKISQYYADAQYQNSELKAATAELLKGLQKAGLK